MRDEQVHRYSRHILLPDVGGLGQTALLVSTARIELRESEPDAELVAASYLAAGGVGMIVLRGASDQQLAGLTVRGPDTKFRTDADATVDAREVVLQPRPTWWPGTDGDHVALSFWRGGLAAARWMADIATR